jgi:hypothetical protein
MRKNELLTKLIDYCIASLLLKIIFTDDPNMI